MSGLLWTALGKAANALLRVLVVAALARLLAPSDFGVVTAAMLAVSLSELVAHLGIGPAIVQRRQLEPRHERTAFVSALLLGCLLGVVVWLLAPAVAEVLHIERVRQVLRAFAWIFPLKAVTTVAEALLQRQLRFRLLAAVEAVSYGVGYGLVGIGFAMAGAGVWALVAAQVAQAVVQAASLLSIHPPPRRFVLELRALRELLRFGGGMTIGRVINYFALQGDNLVVGRWLGAAALGFYGRAYQLMGMPASLFGEALERVLFPAMARVQGESARLGRVYLRGCSAVALLTLPAGAGLAVLAPELVALLLGPKWGAVVVPLRVLAPGVFLRTSYRISDSLAHATGAVYRRAWRQAIYAVLVVAGAFAGSRWGIAGVSLGVLGALFCNFFLMAHLSLSVAGLHWPSFLRAHIPGLALTTITGAVAWTSAELLRNEGVAPVLLIPTVTAAGLLCAVALVRLRRATFLGEGGEWVLRTVAVSLPTLVAGLHGRRSRHAHVHEVEIRP